MTLLQAAGSQFNQQFNFFTHLYIPVIVWLLAVTFLFILLLRKYTFGNWSIENPNPFSGETFDMPRGIFRGILTMSLLFIAVIFEMVNIHQGHDESNIIEFLTAFKMMIAFYFGAKVMHHVTSTDRAKVEIKAQQSIAEATKATHSGAESETSSSEGSDFEDPDAAM